MTPLTLDFLLLLSFCYLLLYCNAAMDSDTNFLRCMSMSTLHSEPSNYVHAQNSSSYSRLLQSAEQNPRWLNLTYLKPRFIITPFTHAQIQLSISCSRSHGMQLRVKSGGHDYEGLSFLCKSPFIVIDLINLRSICIDVEKETAWVESGATLGELYYATAKESSEVVYGFPAGICPSVGVGGHLSGGGIGTMMRKYGVAADNVIDAYIVDVNARILNRDAMGEDLFWAIRGAGASSFGIIVSWKIKLVRVPNVVTVFTLPKQLDDRGIELVHKWQYIAHKLPQELFTRVIIQNHQITHQNSKNNNSSRMVVASFNSMFLGKKHELIALMNSRFPELGLKLEDCQEMSWIQSVLYFAGYKKDQPMEVLLNRTVQNKSSFKAKSDFVTNAIKTKALKGIRKRVLQEDLVFIIFDPMGGKMQEISESEIAYPHRKGNMYNIQYLVKWIEESSSRRHLEWINSVYEFMKPYVSTSPRAAYVNYRDLDIGSNLQQVNTSYTQSRIWGEKYFKNNFKRLARIKGKLDPENFFRNEQTIPVL